MESWAHHWQMPEVSWLNGVESESGAKQWNEMVKITVLVGDDYFNLGYLLGTCKPPRSAGAYK
jgi:hypothetical protein